MPDETVVLIDDKGTVQKEFLRQEAHQKGFLHSIVVVYLFDKKGNILIQQRMDGRFDHSAEVEIISDDRVAIKVGNDIIPKIIGAKGKTVIELEKKIGMHIDIMPKVKTLGKEINFRSDETGAYLVFAVDERTGKTANFYSGEEYLFSATIGKNGQIRVSKYSEVGHSVIKGLLKGELKVFV